MVLHSGTEHGTNTMACFNSTLVMIIEKGGLLMYVQRQRMPTVETLLAGKATSNAGNSVAKSHERTATLCDVVRIPMTG